MLLKKKTSTHQWIIISNAHLDNHGQCLRYRSKGIMFCFTIVVLIYINFQKGGVYCILTIVAVVVVAVVRLLLKAPGEQNQPECIVKSRFSHMEYFRFVVKIRSRGNVKWFWSEKISPHGVGETFSSTTPCCRGGDDERLPWSTSCLPRCRSREATSDVVDQAGPTSSSRTSPMGWRHGNPWPVGKIQKKN